MVFLQDAEGNNPRTKTTQQDTGGYDYVIGVDHQSASGFSVSIVSTMRTFYWFTIGY